MSKKKHNAAQEPEQTPAMEAEDAVKEAVTAEGAETEAAAEIEAASQEPENTEQLAMKAALETQQKKCDEYLALAQRVQADFDNFRRRNQSVRHDAYEEGARAFAATLLPVIDNLERALLSAQDAEDAKLKEGVDMVLRQMTDCFEKRGITAIDRKGEKFDPALENAVMQGTAEDGEPGTVCEVLQKGYQMDGAVLRHAMVKVVPD